MNQKVIEISQEEAGYIIDGYFDEWSSINQVDINGDGNELEGDASVSDSCDLIDLWFSQDASSLYFSFSAGGAITAPPYHYHVFIDEDNNPETGYHSGGSAIGIDLMCENGYLWRYSGISGEWSWEFLTQVNYLTGITNPKQAELVIPKTFLAGNRESISFIYHINDSKEETEDDYAPNNYSLNAYSSLLVNVKESEKALPEELELTHHVYPNPFNSSVTFDGSFNKVLNSDVEIKIYDVLGRLIHKDIAAKAGSIDFKYFWNTARMQLSSGIYLYQIAGNKENLFKNGKIIYLK